MAEPEDFGERDVKVLEPRWWPAKLYGLLALCDAAGCAGWVNANPAVPIAVTIAVPVVLWVAFGALVSGAISDGPPRHARTSRRRARANHNGLFLDGEHVLRTDDLVMTRIRKRETLRPGVHEVYVELVRSGWHSSTWLQVADDDEAEALQRALVLHPTQMRAWRGGLHAPSLAYTLFTSLGVLAVAAGVGGCLVYLVQARPEGLLRTAAPIAAVAVLALALSIVHLEWLCDHVTIGDEGVTVHGRGRCCKVPIGDIARVVLGPRDRELVLVLRDGRELRWKGDREGIRKLHEAAQAVLSRRGAAESPIEEALRGRTAAELLRVTEGYRALVLQPERLWQLVEDGRLDRALRARAAVALSRDLGDDDRARLVRIARRTADDDLRILLHRVAEGSELAALDDALRRLGPPDDEPEEAQAGGRLPTGLRVVEPSEAAPLDDGIVSDVNDAELEEAPEPARLRR
jgi:hypothetical protein